ncbi:MAG TPA: superinfection immunity protein [Pilimelia sp.]|nr:superinfection immunity protein [Pilimelia sp.]
MTHPQFVRDKRTKPIQLTVAWCVALLSLGYMLPWAIAATRGKANQGSIGLLNLLLGWTFIGWIVALVMACAAHQGGVVAAPPQPQAPPPGWYPDPAGSGQQAYWNGYAWTSPPQP